MKIKTDITKENVRRAQLALADNGIELDETATVLQALGYILLDTELDELLDWDIAYPKKGVD